MCPFVGTPTIYADSVVDSLHCCWKLFGWKIDDHSFEHFYSFTSCLCIVWILTSNRDFDDLKAIGVGRRRDTARNSSPYRDIARHRIGDAGRSVAGLVFRPIRINTTKWLAATAVDCLLFDRCYVIAYIWRHKQKRLLVTNPIARTTNIINWTQPHSPNLQCIISVTSSIVGKANCTWISLPCAWLISLSHSMRPRNETISMMWLYLANAKWFESIKQAARISSGTRWITCPPNWYTENTRTMIVLVARPQKNSERLLFPDAPCALQMLPQIRPANLKLRLSIPLKKRVSFTNATTSIFPWYSSSACKTKTTYEMNTRKS